MKTEISSTLKMPLSKTQFEWYASASGKQKCPYSIINNIQEVINCTSKIKMSVGDLQKTDR